MSIRIIRRPPAEVRKRLLKKHDGRCAICGIENDEVPLELAHIVPLSKGGESSEENLTLLCPNCHRSFDFHPREVEFVSFLAKLIEKSGKFKSVQTEQIIDGEVRYRVDIIATEAAGATASDFLIECKNFVAANSVEVQRTIQQLRHYRELKPGSRLVLAVPSTLGDSQIAALIAEEIEVWDLGELVRQFRKQLPEMEASYFKSLLLIHAARSTRVTREQELIHELESYNPGKKDCYLYQHLVGEIVEHLFYPPLGRPIAENSDESKSNRRDFIMANYAEAGFWAFMREKYEADYVVIDAKNYSRKVRKPDVLQIANYLKPHGAGSFGIIVSRNGGDSAGCRHALREQWMLYKKLIIVLDDNDVKAMLLAKSDGREPEGVLGSQIESFRLSM